MGAMYTSCMEKPGICPVMSVLCYTDSKDYSLERLQSYGVRIMGEEGNLSYQSGISLPSVADLDSMDMVMLETCLAMVCGNEPDFATEFLGFFVEDGLMYLHNMQQALATGDTLTLKLAAHTLKSSSAQIGALQLAAYCREIEHRSQQESPEVLAAWVDAAYAAYTQVCHDLQPWMNSDDESQA